MTPHDGQSTALNSTHPGSSGLFGSYRLVRSLGSGGMAQVFLALDTRTSEKVALKVLFQSDFDASVLLGLKREFRAMSRIAHECVVGVREYGVADGRPYMAMEFIQGEPIAVWLERRFPDLRDGRRFTAAALLLLQVAAALDHCHRQHIVHRDLKPDNILVTATGRVKVIDFGVARDAAEEGEGAEDEGVAMGTLAYSSPEQVSGRQLDGRSDLYSLGVVAYELLAGVKPFAAEHMGALIVKHVTEPPPPPEGHNPALPWELREMVLKLLAKQPHDRHRTGRDLARQLRSFLSSRPLTLEETHLLAHMTELMPEPGVQLFEPDFTGRSLEKAVFRVHMDNLEQGGVSLLLLGGETGMGVGRFLNETLADARLSGWKVLRSRFHSADARAYQGWTEVVTSLATQLEPTQLPRLSDSLGLAGATLSQTFVALGALLGRAGQVHSTADSSSAERKVLAFGLRQLLDHALKAPTLLVLEEAQLADAPSVELLLQLFAGQDTWQPPHPCLIVTSFHTDDLPNQHPLRPLLDEDRAPGPLLQLGPMSLPEVDEMVTSMLGRTAGLKAFAAQLHRVTGGNPFFLTEAIRSMVEDGRLSPIGPPEDPTGWLLTPPPGRPMLPGDLKEILVERIDRLTANQRGLLEIAAVLGRDFSAELLNQVTGLSEDALLDFLDEMMQRKLLTEHKRAGSISYTFYHARIRETLYAQLEERQKVSCHKAAAEALARMKEKGSIELQAAHLFAAGEVTQAATLLVDVAEQILKESSSLEALRLLGRASECVASGGENIPATLRIRLDLRMGAALCNIGRTAESADHLRSAHARASSAGLPALVAESLYQQGRLASRAGDFGRASRCYWEALQLQRGVEDRAALVPSLNGLAGTLWRLGDLKRAARLYQEAVTVCQFVPSASEEATATNGMGLVCVQEGAFPRSLELFTQAARLYRSVKREALALQCELNAASSMRVLGELSQGAQLALRAREALLKMGDRHSAATACILGAQFALDLGQFELVDSALEQAEGLAQSYGSPVHLIHTGLVRGELQLVHHRPSEALTVLSHALSRAAEGGYRDLAARALRLMARAQLATGSPGEALSLARRAEVEARVVSSGLEIAEVQLVLGEAHRQRGEFQSSRDQLDHAVDFLRKNQIRPPLVFGLLYLAMLAADQSERVQAVTHLSEALALVGEMRRRLPEDARRRFDTRPEVRQVATLWRRLRAGE